MSVGSNLKDSRIAAKNAEIFTQGGCRLDILPGPSHKPVPLKGSHTLEYAFHFLVALLRIGFTAIQREFVGAKAMWFEFASFN